MRLHPFLPMLMIAACGPMNGRQASNSLAESGAENSGNEATTNAPFAEVEGAHPNAPGPAPIPAKFRGTWAENEAACADLSNHSRLTISGRTVRHPDFVIFGDSFTFPTTEQFAVKGKVEATGAPIEAHYSINAANDQLTDEAGGGAVRVRCA